jgi:hypothetical protein
MSKMFFINVWRKIIFDIYFTEFGAASNNLIIEFEIYFEIYKTFINTQ